VQNTKYKRNTTKHYIWDHCPLHRNTERTEKFGNNGKEIYFHRSEHQWHSNTWRNMYVP